MKEQVVTIIYPNEKAVKYKESVAIDYIQLVMDVRKSRLQIAQGKTNKPDLRFRIIREKICVRL